jgi:hypothetical protein
MSEQKTVQLKHSEIMHILHHLPDKNSSLTRKLKQAANTKPVKIRILSCEISIDDPHGAFDHKWEGRYNPSDIHPDDLEAMKRPEPMGCVRVRSLDAS